MNQNTAAPAAPQDRSTEFVAVEGGAETTSAGTLLIAAYAVMWALLAGFILLSWRRQQRIERRLGEIERTLGRSPSGQA